MGQKVYGGHTTSPASVVNMYVETRKHIVFAMPALNHWLHTFSPKNKADSKKIHFLDLPPPQDAGKSAPIETFLGDRDLLILLGCPWKLVTS